jgi:hypothetical protein
MISRIIGSLKDKQVEWAMASVNKTSGDQFDFGHACGVNAGLRMALELIDAALRDQEQKDTSL